jgi:hypothetical protein
MRCRRRLVNRQAVLAKLPKPDEAIMTFTAWKNFVDVPLVVYADFECFTTEKTEARGAGSVVATNDRLASVCYAAVGHAGYEPPAEHRLCYWDREDPGVFFVVQLLRLALHFKRAKNLHAALRLTDDVQRAVREAADCALCRKPLHNDRVAHHNHFTGEFSGALHAACNRRLRVNFKVPVFFHNLMGFDGHPIVRAIRRIVATPELLQRFEEMTHELAVDNDEDPEALIHEQFNVGKFKFAVLAKSDERYQTITFGPLEFKDSFRFLEKSLDSLVQARRGDFGPGELAKAFPILAERHPHRARLNLLCRKFKMPFAAMCDASVFGRPAVLELEEYRDFFGDGISPEEHEDQRYAARELCLHDFADMLRCYNMCDCLQLADVFEAFRATVRERCGLDPVHYVGFPRLALDTMLLRSGARVELIHEFNGGWELVNDVDSNVRGGLSCIFSRYAAANNPHLAGLGHLGLGYDTAQPTTWILPLDVNALYPTAMTLPLPVGDYALVANPSAELVKRLIAAYRESNAVGYMVVCDIWVESDRHDALDFAPVAKRASALTELTDAQGQAFAAYACKSGDTKLMPFLGLQRQVAHHIALLKYYVERMGVSFGNVSRVWRWRQEPYMREHILDNVAIRARFPKSDPRNELAKRESNGLYGMHLQDKQAYCNTTVHARHGGFVKAAESPLMRSFHIFEPEEAGFLGIVHRLKGHGITLDTPRLVGWAILELSKRHMYHLWYDGVKRVWPSAQLLMMDTDSFHVKVQSPNAMSDIARVNAGEFDDFRIDTGAVEQPGQNVNALGVLKLEYHAAEFCGVRAKCYSELKVSEAVERKFKGVPAKVVRKFLTHQDYKRIVLDADSGLENGRPKALEVRSIVSREHSLEHRVARKKGLAPANDKVFELVTPIGFASRPLGHYLNEPEAELEAEPKRQRRD